MMLDLWVWSREPRFLGEPVVFPEIKEEKLTILHAAGLVIRCL